MSEFESLIPNLMKLKGWNVGTLQRKTSLSRMTAIQLSKGEVPGAVATLLKLCVAFECQPNDVLLKKEG